MSQRPRILAFAGSTRRESTNRRLARAAAAIATDTEQADVTVVDLRDYPLPIFDADIEAQGLPEPLLQLRALFARHDTLVVASPEYNGFFPPVLKNALDWLSRPALGEPRHAVFNGKPVLLLSAVGGKSGGPAGLQQLRQQLLHLKAVPFVRQFVLPTAATAFDELDRISDPVHAAELADTVIGFVQALHAPAAAPVAVGA